MRMRSVLSGVGFEEINGSSHDVVGGLFANVDSSAFDKLLKLLLYTITVLPITPLLFLLKYNTLSPFLST